jgi:Tetratricopeptide repeat
MSATPPPTNGPAPAAKLLASDYAAASPVTGWRSWLPISVVPTRKGTRIRIDWRKALIALFVLTLSGWLLSATGAYLFVKYSRGFTEVKFTHVLLMPWKIDEYRAARGEFLIREGTAKLKAKNYRDAFYDLRVGTSLSPQNGGGRMLLAQLYLAQQRPDLARQTLLDGLMPNRRDAEYLKALFSYMLRQQADFEIVKIADRLLSDAGPNPDLDGRIRLIATAKSTALFFRGNYDNAEDTLKRYHLMNTADGQLLAVQIAWERGEHATVFSQLESLSNQYPAYETIYTQYAAYLREAGMEDDLRRLCILRQIRFPDQPRPRIDLLYLFDKAKDEERIQSDIEGIFKDYAKNGEIMLALADFAANTGRAALALRIYHHCKEHRLPWDGPALMTVEAHIVAKEYQEALVTVRQMLKENPEWGKRFYSVFNGLQAIANFGLDDTSSAQIFLNNFLNQSGGRADNLIAVSNRLRIVGAKQQAQQVLNQAVHNDPLNQTALSNLIKINIELGNADDVAINVRTLLGMRKPPHAVLAASFDHLASDHNIFVLNRSILLNDLRKMIESSPERSDPTRGAGR